VSALMTKYMEHQIEALDIPSIPEFIEMISDTDAGVYACLASADLFKQEQDDNVEQVEDIITIGDFYEMAAGGQIIFT
jgi:peroxiredoxin family protein